MYLFTFKLFCKNNFLRSIKPDERIIGESLLFGTKGIDQTGSNSAAGTDASTALKVDF